MSPALPALPACPHLPPAPARMDAGALSAHGSDRGAGFYLSALTYAHYLWQQGHAARALLKLDRALLADVRGTDAVLASWPLPYPAIAWVLREVPPGVFFGNPRVHYQHLADRMNEPRRELRRWRSWACWLLTRRVRPEFPPDPKHKVTEPTEAQILAQLESHGLPGEAAGWRSVLLACSPATCSRPTLEGP